MSLFGKDDKFADVFNRMLESSRKMEEKLFADFERMSAESAARAKAERARDLRERAAIAAFQSYLDSVLSTEKGWSPKDFAREAVECADALLAELAKERAP